VGSARVHHKVRSDGTRARSGAPDGAYEIVDQAVILLELARPVEQFARAAYG
jgi:hypothetical protein